MAFSIFAIEGSEKCSFTIIDTHCIPESIGGNNSGILLFVDFKKQHVDRAIKKVSLWIRKRILTSSRRANLQSLILMKPKTAIQQEHYCDSDDDRLLIESMDQFITSQLDTDHNKGDSDHSYTLPEQLSSLHREDEILWKGHSFGYSTFKPFQLRAIQAIQEGRDVVVIQPTGSGKSICFQIPSLIENNKMTIIICPTISLIQSQVAGLEKKGIDAIAFGHCAGGNARGNNESIWR